MSKNKSLENVREFPKRILIFLSLLFALLAVGTTGFKIVYRQTFLDSFLMTFETLAFMFHSSSGVGKLLEIFLAIFGVFLIWWVLWGVFDMLLEGSFSEYLKISKFLNRLKKMKNHYIIAGGGRVGEDIALTFLKDKTEYVIIEKDAVVFSNLKKKSFIAIHGDASDESVLNQAKISSARAIILAMPETEKNLLITMLAKEMNPAIEVYARADKPAFVSRLKKAGAKVVVVPELVAAEKLLEAMRAI